MTHHDNTDQWPLNGIDPHDDLTPDEHLAAGCFQLGCYALAFILGLLLCWVFSGCSTPKQLTTTIHHTTTDTIYKTKVERDSIFRHDSIFVHVYQRGDTIFKEHTRWLTRWRDRLLIDTVYQSRTDTLTEYREVVKEVPARLTWWQQVRMHVGGILIFLLIILAARKIYVYLHPRI